MSFLWILTKIRTDFLTWIMSFMTYFGDKISFIIIAMLVFWCVDKKRGYYLFSIGLLGTIANQCLKMIFRVSRPWIKDPLLPVIESAKPASTGYSFPSGHTQNAVGTIGGIARTTKKIWLRIICIVLPCIVGFSRMYLGVHTPLDVGFSVIFGVILIFALYPIIEKVYKNPKYMNLFFLIMSVIALGAAVYMQFLNPSKALNESELIEYNLNHSEGLKNTSTMFGCSLGIWISYIIDTNIIHFNTDAPWWGQIIKVVLGFSIVLLIKYFLKGLLGTSYIMNMVEYFVLVIIACGIYPACFRFLPHKKISK